MGKTNYQTANQTLVLLCIFPALERYLGGGVYSYLGYARLISFEINFITKETSHQNLHK